MAMTPEERKAYNDIYHAIHREEIKAQRAAYYVAHRDEIKNRNAAYRKAHREEIKAYYIAHHEEIRSKQISYKTSHREEVRSRQAINDRIRRIDLRQAALKAYGNKCACCGEMTPEFLAIDHVNGGGKEHRKETGWGVNFYKWLKKNEYPKEGFQILCHNCNLAKQYYGSCPHMRALS